MTAHNRERGGRNGWANELNSGSLTTSIGLSCGDDAALARRVPRVWLCLNYYKQD